jgi:hypothetical protein
VGHRLVAIFLEVWDEPRAQASLLGLLRSAVSDDRAASMTRALIMAEVAAPIVAALGVPDATLRATLVGSQLAGLGMIRYAIRVEPLASADPAVIVEALGPTISRYLTGTLTSEA